MLASFSQAQNFNSDSVVNQDSQENYFEGEDNLNFTVNASNSEVADIRLESPNESLIESDMEQLSSNPYQIYNYNFNISEQPPAGRWGYTLSLNGGSNSLERNFLVANSTPVFQSYSSSPDVLELGKNLSFEAKILDAEEDVGNLSLGFENSSKNFSVSKISERDNRLKYRDQIESFKTGSNHFSLTAEDTQSRSSTVEGQFNVAGDLDSTSVNVNVAPECSSSQAYFLVPGNGKIVQNKTGVFVEIISNNGNIESNITIEELRVTSEGDEKWNKGAPIGPEIRSYNGETFRNVLMGESVTYFKLFHASHPLGNYTGRSTVSSECTAEGPQNSLENPDELDRSYKCDDVSSEEFFCWNRKVVSKNRVPSETTTGELNETTSKNVSRMVKGSESYKGEITLNSTEYNIFSFNSSETSGYDYSCITINSSIEEKEECVFESQTVSDYNIEVQDIDYSGKNASFALMENNNNYLNTSLYCDSQENDTALCNYTLAFESSFSFHNNFEIVSAIGEDRGGGDEPGNLSAQPEPDPEPEPEPEPDPEPDPRPEISVDIRPLEQQYQTKQGIYQAAELEVENVGNQNLSDVELVPQIDKFRENWSVRNARVANLSVNETVERDVFVQPDPETSPGSYVVPVAANYDDRQLDLDYFRLKVTKSTFIPEITIQEAPSSMNVRVNQDRDAPILVENTGRTPVENITAEIQNLDDCGSYSIEDSDQVLEVNQSVSLSVSLEADQNIQSCNATLVVSSTDGAYAFSDMAITVLPDEGIIPEKQRVPLFALLWTTVLVAYAVFTKRYALSSLSIKIPFILIIVGEAVIILYLLSNNLGVPLMSILPF